jgi:hypothetical protein
MAAIPDPLPYGASYTIDADPGMAEESIERKHLGEQLRPRWTMIDPPTFAVYWVEDILGVPTEVLEPSWAATAEEAVESLTGFKPMVRQRQVRAVPWDPAIHEPLRLNAQQPLITDPDRVGRAILRIFCPDDSPVTCQREVDARIEDFIEAVGHEGLTIFKQGTVTYVAIGGTFFNGAVHEGPGPGIEISEWGFDGGSTDRREFIVNGVAMPREIQRLQALMTDKEMP